MVKCLLDYGDLGVEEPWRKFVSMGCDGNNIFQAHWTSVMMQIKLKVATFFIGVHYFAHNINLTMINLSTLDLMHWMEVILQSFYTFLGQNLKKSQFF
jgi:hypothetical protein